MTAVYIISPEGAEGPCKVGISNDPWKRLASLQTGSPRALEVREVYEFPSRDAAMAMERLFHECYADWRLHGEWFDILFEDANYWLFENTVGDEVRSL